MGKFVSAVEKKFQPALSDPLGFLAGMIDVEKVPFVPGDFEYDEVETPKFVIVATRTALANGVVLYAQLQEMLNKHPQLAQFVKDPLGGLMRDAMPELEEFIQGKEVACEGQGTINIDISRRIDFCPRPVNSYPKLCRLAHIAAARPTNNNAIESRWSQVTLCHHAGQRTSGPEHLSCVFRKKDPETLGIADEFTSEGAFREMFQEARQFRRDHKLDYKKLYRVKHDESEDRQECSVRTKAVYKNSKIVDPDANRPGKRKKDVENLCRTKGRPKGRHDEALSDEEADSESEDTMTDTSLHSSGEEDDGEQDPPDPPDGGPDVEEPSDLEAPAVEGGDSSAEHQRPQDLANEPCGSDKGEISEEEEEDSDESDAESISDRSVSDSDLDIPLGQRPAPSSSQKDEDIWRNVGSHPWPVLKELNRDEAKRESRYKLSYTRFLFRSEKWKDTEIVSPPPPAEAIKGSRGGGRKTRAAEEEKTVKKATLKRQDGLSFDLITGGVHFYVLFEVTGLELIYVQRIFWGIGENKGKLCVEFSRVLSTQEASECTPDEEDLVANVRLDDGSTTHTTRLGRKSLDAAVKKLNEIPQKNERPIFHRGDWPIQTRACNIVGFVAWSSVGDHPRFVPKDERDEMERILLQSVTATQPKIKKMAEIDWVFCGADFSDNKDPID